MNEYLTFHPYTVEGRKTPIITIRSKLHGVVLGEIKWYGRWRQHAFFPAPGTIWNPDCLSEITDYIKSLRRIGKYRESSRP